MKLQYVGQSFGVGGLTNGKIYECLGLKYPFVRVIDDSGEDYVYLINAPGPLDRSIPPGKWKVIEDDAYGSLQRAVAGNPYKRPYA